MPEVVQPVKSTSWRSLPARERFYLISGAVGLFADFLTLISFVAVRWNLGRSYVLFVVATLMLIVYGWVAVSWALVRLWLNDLAGDLARGRAFAETVRKSVIGLGCVLIPVNGLWFISTFPTQPIDGDLMLVSFMFAAFLLAPAIGLIVSLILSNLMPFFYRDLRFREMSEAIIRKSLANNWPAWDKRITDSIETRKWVGVESLRGIAEHMGISVESLELVLAEYESRHFDKVEYGYLYIEAQRHGKALLKKVHIGDALYTESFAR